MQESALQHLVGWQNGRARGPHTLNVRPTDFCNLLCKSCAKGFDQKDRRVDFSRELPDARLIRLIHDAGDMGVEFINIDGGGEPFLRRKVTLQMMTLAKEYGMEGLLVTNGTLLRPEDLKLFVDIGWDRIHFSLDGPDKKTHEFLRGVPGCFDTTLNNIRKLVAYREEQGKDRPEIIIATVISNSNHHRMDDMVRLVHSLGLTSLYLQPLYTQTDSAYELLPSEKEMNRFQDNINDVERLADELGVHTNISQFKAGDLIESSNKLGKVIKEDTQEAQGATAATGQEFLSSQCYASWMYLGVRPDGSVAPCPSVPSETFRHLTLRDKTLKEIWWGESFTLFRRRMIEREHYSFCETCCGSMVMDTRDYRKELIKVTSGG